MPADELKTSREYCGGMPGEDAVQLDVIADKLDEVSQCISRRLVSSDEGIERLLEHVVSGRGKMLRPAMVLLAGRCCGGETQKHIEIAAMVELVHIATLLHDDVIDEAQSRRGSKTINALWGDRPAVLLGMLLLGKVFSMGGEVDMPEVSQELSCAAIRICEGEMGQNLLKDSRQVSEQEYITIVRDKTASLFGSSCYLGGFASGADEGTLASLREFGICVGVAFQITDDLLDISGDEGDMGKTLGSDLAKRKMTLPMIHFLEQTNAGDRESVIERLSQFDRAELREALAGTGSYDHAKAEAKRYSERACRAISELRDSPAKRTLLEIAEYSASRGV